MALTLIFDSSFHALIIHSPTLSLSIYKYPASALEKEKSRTKVNMYPWILQQRCIDMLPIVTAPTPLRNKCELTFGYQYMFPVNTSSTAECEIAPNDTNTEIVVADDHVEIVTPINEIEPSKDPAVGFMATGWAGGVSFSNTLPNIPYEVSMIVDIVNAFLLNSPLVPYDSTTHTGFWRILTIRTSRRTKECMIIIQHNSPPSVMVPSAVIPDNSASGSDEQGYKDTEPLVGNNSIFERERDRLISLLINADLLTAPSVEAVPTTIKVTSIFFQEFAGLSNPPPEHPVQVRFFIDYCFDHSATVQYIPNTFSFLF